MTDPLFTPLDIGPVRVKHRIMQAAHSKLYAIDGVESAQDAAYFARRAQGGTALMIAGNRFVHPSSTIRGFVDGWDPRITPADERLTDAVHAHGAKVFVQLNHHGAQASPDGPSGPRPVYSATRLLSPSTGAATIAMDEHDMRAFRDGWARSARLAERGGFDGVEVHMAHGYLLAQFLSPLDNTREDAFGGDVVRRARFPLDVLRAVRDAVSDRVAVGIRIVVDEHVPGGVTHEQALETIAHLREHVQLDFLNTAGGGYHNTHWVFPSSAMPAAWLRDDVASVKRHHPDIAVFGVGAAASPEEARAVIADGVADMVALTRAQIADPDLAHKLAAGATDVRHCIRLNQGCLGRTGTGQAMACTVNPVVGRESTLATPAAAERLRVLVIGGGPAGLTAAIEAARLGHEVTLAEATDALGGQLRLARHVPGRESVQLLIDDLERDARASGVRIRLGRCAGDQVMPEADAVVIATGSAPDARGTSATDAIGLALQRAVAAAPAGVVQDAWAAIDTPPRAGARIMLVDDDGGPYASGVALALRARGAHVTIVTRFDTTFPFIRGSMDRQHLHERLHAAPGSLEVRLGSRIERIGEEVVIVDLATGTQHALAADRLVLATPRASLLPPHGGVRVGDALAPRGIDAAVLEGFEAARALGDARGAPPRVSEEA